MEGGGGQDFCSGGEPSNADMEEEFFLVLWGVPPSVLPDSSPTKGEIGWGECAGFHNGSAQAFRCLGKP